jgi:hypothetical protein
MQGGGWKAVCAWCSERKPTELRQAFGLNTVAMDGLPGALPEVWYDRCADGSDKKRRRVTLIHVGRFVREE